MSVSRQKEQKMFRRMYLEDSRLLRSVAKWYSQGMAAIFMLHRVAHVTYPRPTPNEDLKVSPEYLDSVISYLGGKGYAFVSIDELHEVLVLQKKVRKLIVFTLDDGYRDNLTHALPVFAAHNVPFTVYVTTSFPDRTADLWWYDLDRQVQENEQIFLSDGTKFSCQTIADKWSAFMAIRSRFLAGTLHRDELRPVHGADVAETLCLNWSEIRDLARHPLTTIGAHTLTHPALGKLCADAALHEMDASRQALEKQTGRAVQHFAYPFGDHPQVGAREFRIAADLGFKTAVTTRTGHIFAGHRRFLTALPRIYLHENGLRLDSLLFNNVLLANKLKRIATV